MRKRGEHGEHGPDDGLDDQPVAAPGRPRVAVSFCLVPAGLCLLLLAGCAGDNRAASTTPNDPLLGRGAVTQGGPSTLPPGPAPAPPTLPAPPAPPASLTSNAALAGSPAPAFDPSRDLRIGPPAQNPAGLPNPNSFGPPNQNPAGLPSQNPDSRYGQTPGAGTTLQRPEPAADATSRRDALLSRTSGVAAGLPIGSYEQAQMVLAARGVTWQRLETSGDHGWKFSCSVPNRQNPSVYHTVEGQANDYLSAVRAVIDQMDREQ